jgi:hypothetical protein
MAEIHHIAPPSAPGAVLDMMGQAGSYPAWRWNRTPSITVADQVTAVALRAVWAVWRPVKSLV